MSIDNMKQISQAEAQAIQLRAEAQAEAKRTLDAGRKEAASLVEEARKKADEAYKTVISQAEAEAQEAYEAHLKEVQAQCEAERAAAQEHKEEAMKVIIGKVVE